MKNQASTVPKPITYVVIVNWNGKEILQKCLQSFFANTSSPDSHVVVVDNASIDGSVEMLQEKFRQITLIKNSYNTGFSKANNQGIRFALKNNAKNILLLNNDVEITDPRWLENLSNVLESDSKIGIVGCKLIYPNGVIQHAGGVINLSMPYHRGDCSKDAGQFNKVEFVDYVTGAVLLIKSDVIRRIGLLDEGFSPLYFEDTDWCVRATLYGYKVAYTPNPKLIHYSTSSSSKLSRERRLLYSRRSFIRFFLLNYKNQDIIKRILLFESKELIRCLVMRSQHGKLPITLRSDASNRLQFFAQVWLASIRDLKDIIARRRQRFILGAKLHV